MNILFIGIAIMFTSVGVDRVPDIQAAIARRGLQPPIEVPAVQGFQWHREESKKLRKQFFATHEKVGGVWKLKSEPFGVVR